MPRLHEIQERRAKAVTAMRALADKVEGENRDYDDSESKRHADLKSEIAGLDQQITRARDVEDAERSAPAIIQAGNRGDGQYEDRARSFSLTTAIRAAMGEAVDNGRERELSAELSRRTGRSFTGIAVPDEVFQVERRTLLTSGDAADLMPNVHRGDLFIDMRRSAIVTARLGATVLDGLVGTVDIPKQTASGTAAWIAEDAALTETDGDFEDVNLSPKTVGSMTSFSRRTLINSVPSIEALVRRDLAAVIANAIDLAAMTGTGTGNTPTGITSASNVASKTLAGPTWAQVLDFIAAVQGADADIGSMGWALSPAAVKVLRSTVKDATNGGEGYLMEAPGMLAGYAAATTTALAPSGSPSTASVIFGAWSQLLIGRWSGVDLLVNPYGDAAYAKGRVQVRAMQDVDVGVRHGQSFAYAADLSAS